MRNEIGSFFEKRDELTNPNRSIDCMLREIYKTVEYLGSGRDAILATLTIAEREGIKKVCMLPSYICESIISVFEHMEWEIHYYPINEKLRICKDEFVTLLDTIHPGIVFFLPYYGLDIDDELKQIMLDHKLEHNTFILLDLTQSLNLIDDGEWSDFAIISLRKWYSVPEGAVLLSNRNINIKKCAFSMEIYNIKSEAQLMKRDYLKGLDIEKRKYLELNSRFEDEICNVFEVRNITKYTEYVFKNVDFYELKRRRCANFEYLYEKIDKRICVLGENVEYGLYFPIYVENRDQFQKHMSSIGIYMSILWKKPIQIELFSSFEKYIYDHILLIPCDHRYGQQEIDYMLHNIDKYGKLISAQ